MNNTLPTPAEPRRRRVPAKVRAAIDEIVQGRAKNITAAAKKVGLSREYLSRSLGEPHVAEHLRQKAARAVAVGAGRASARLVRLLDAKSEHVSLDAARFTLGVAGIKPAADAQLNVNIEQKAGYVIILSEPGDAHPMKIVSGTDAPEAAYTSAIGTKADMPPDTAEGRD